VEEDAARQVAGPARGGEDDMRVKAVILHHNNPRGAEMLWCGLDTVFDDVEVYDSGSDDGKHPRCQSTTLPNIYWTGAWNKIMAEASDYDAVWMPGADIELLCHVEDYREAIEASLPFGCWSPAIHGRAHPFMQKVNYAHGMAMSVRNVEGMAMACSGELMREVGELVPGSPMGFGQDFWLCHRARQMGLRNVIDGRVDVYHPPGTGYDEKLAHSQMEDAFAGLCGPDFRRRVFEYSESYEGNLVEEISKEDGSMFKIVTIDNGWGVPEFCRIVRQIEGATSKVVMRIGISRLEVEPGVEIVDFDDTLAAVLDADAALFTRVGAANRDYFKRVLDAGVPCVVNSAFHQGAIRHEENGFIYGVDNWAVHWLSALEGSNELRRKVSNAAKGVGGAAEVPIEMKAELPKAPIRASVPAPARGPSRRPGAPTVTVVTPTWKRHPDVVRRSIDCLTLQTFKDWRQLVCSDGPEEPVVRELVEAMGDPRVEYHCTGERTAPGDFGNSVRKSMLERATGDYVLFYDDDNVILPRYLEVMIDAVRGSGREFAVCKIMHFGPLNEAILGRPPVVLDGDPVKLYHVDPLQVLVKREAMQAIGWDVRHGYVADGHTLEALGARFEHVRVDEVLGVHM